LPPEVSITPLAGLINPPDKPGLFPPMTDDTCEECGDRYSLFVCQDCISLYCLSCGLRCDCGQHPVKVDLTATVAKLPSTLEEFLFSEGIYEYRHDGKQYFIIEITED